MYDELSPDSQSKHGNFETQIKGLIYVNIYKPALISILKFLSFHPMGILSFFTENVGYDGAFPRTWKGWRVYRV